MKTGIYNACLTFVGIICLFVAASCLTTSCTDEEIIQDEQTSTSTNSDDGVPMILDVTINDYDGGTSSRAQVWPDGATLIIHPKYGSSQLLKSGCHYIFAVYYAEIGWVAYNLNNNLNSDDETIWGTDDTTIRYLDSYKYDDYKYDDYGEVIASATATCALYEETIDSYQYYISKGVFHLRAYYLMPKLGRVRFKGNSSADVLYNHAKYEINSAGNNYASYIDKLEYSASHGVLSFAKDADGEYYSNYLYADVIPDLRIGDYVYRYKGSLGLTSGKSGVIDLPTEDNYSTNWIREPYFEETKNIEEALNTYYKYYHIYAQEYSDTRQEDSNAIDSQVGINIEVKYTPKSGHSGIDFELYTENGYEGSGWYTSPGIESRHCCGSNLTKFYPIIQLNSSINLGAIVHSIKISNF
jgi:hypothetical protein